MVLIEWQDDYCTGVAGVDYEHQELIKQINEIYSLIDNNADRDDIIDSLGDIYGSISAHFTLEEQLMEKHGYDKFREHKADHERLLDDIREITIEFESTDELPDEKFRQKLSDWFLVHFGTHDARLHGLAKLMDHQPVCESTMKTLIRKAKNRLLRNTT